MDTRGLIQSAWKHNLAFPNPSDATYKFDQEWPTGLRDIQI